MADLTDLEPHFTVEAIAEQLSLSPEMVRRMFEHVPGVVRIVRHQRGKRRYITIRVPRSVLLRVYKELTNRQVDVDRR